MKLQHPLNLSAYLLKPVQRVLKYKLLLEVQTVWYWSCSLLLLSGLESVEAHKGG